MRVLAMMAMLAGTIALAGGTAQAASPCPNQGLKTATRTFHTAKGRFAYKVELALTGEQQACGLMFRETMARDAGMAFPMVPARQTGFWMENTILPLDIIYVSPRGRVLNVRQGQPYSREVLTAAGVTAEVIELNVGEAARIGLKPGDRVSK